MMFFFSRTLSRSGQLPLAAVYQAIELWWWWLLSRAFRSAPCFSSTFSTSSKGFASKFQAKVGRGEGERWGESQAYRQLLLSRWEQLTSSLFGSASHPTWPPTSRQDGEEMVGRVAGVQDRQKFRSVGPPLRPCPPPSSKARGPAGGVKHTAI